MAGVSFQVTGSNRAYQLGKQLKALDNASLAKELRKGVSRALRPAQQVVRKSVPAYMPPGYAPTLAKALQLRTSNLATGLRITGNAKGRPRPRKVTDLDAGRLRHPLFGNRNHWYGQTVRRGFFTEPLREQAPAVRAELNRVLADVAKKITS